MLDRMPLINLWVLVLLLCADTAVGGPPLVTDDTGTAGNGIIEVIGYVSGESRDVGDSAELPGIDISYGVSDVLQINATFPWQHVDNDGEPSDSGWGTASLGMKWRFLDNGDSALAFAPVVAIPMSNSSTLRGLIDDTYVLSLPLLGSLQRGAWELTGNIAYAISSQDFNAVTYGASAGYDITDNFRLLGEIWGVDFHDDGSSLGFTNWRAGTQWALSESLTLLAAYGGPVSSQLDPAEQLNSDFYLGLQYNLAR